MPVLRISLLGSLELSYGDCLLPMFPTQKSRDIFSYLSFHRERYFQRHALAGTFWETRSEISARKCLSTELWRIRSVLKPKEADEDDTYLTVSRDSVGFNLKSKAWLDVSEFEDTLEPFTDKPGSALSLEDSRRLKKAVELYRGDLLEGSEHEWCLHERERLKILYLAVLEQLLDYHQTRMEWGAAIAYGKQALIQDSLLEQVHRKLMYCYFAMGERAMALRQYSTCAELLREELHVEPMEETSRLYHEIRSEVVSDHAMPEWEQPLLGGPASRLDQITTDLYLAQTNMEEAMRRLNCVIEQWNRSNG